MRTESTPEASTQTYKSLFEHHLDAVYSLDLAGHFTSANPACETLSGYPVAELLQQSFAPLIAPDCLEKTFQHFHEAAAGRAQHYETALLHKEGHRLELQVTNVPIFIDGEVIGVYGIAKNITKLRRAEKALRESEERYRELFENANDIIYTHDLTGRFTSLNKTGERITGYSREEAVRMNIAQVVSPPYLAQAREMIARKMSEPVSTVYELEIIARDGRRVMLEVSTRIIRQGDHPVGVQGIARDITERKRTEEALRESERRFRDMLETVQMISVQLDVRGRVTFCNPYLLWLTEYRSEEVVGCDWFERFIPADQREMVRTAFVENIEKGLIPVYFENEILTARGERRLVSWNNTALRDGQQRVVGTASIGIDITERKRAEERLLHDALHDPLTGLPNRALFTDHLGLAVERARRHDDYLFAVLFLDLDGFKVVNDELGHAAGDQMLIRVAGRLKSCLRLGDTVARFGGDEFTILLDGIEGLGDAVRVAERILHELTPPFTLGGREAFTTASIGIALSAAGDDRPEDLLRDADAAMYRAKGAGKARFHVSGAEV